jgi:hypothetical protein
MFWTDTEAFASVFVVCSYHFSILLAIISSTNQFTVSICNFRCGILGNDLAAILFIAMKITYQI